MCVYIYIYIFLYSYIFIYTHIHSQFTTFAVHYKTFPPTQNCHFGKRKKNQVLHGFDMRHTLRPDCISQMTTYQILDVNWNIPFPKESLTQRLAPAMQNSTPVPTQALSVEGKDTEHTYLLLYSFYPGCEEGKLLTSAAQVHCIHEREHEQEAPAKCTGHPP